jgi:MscS family membrane protein
MGSLSILMKELIVGWLSNYEYFQSVYLQSALIFVFFALFSYIVMVIYSKYLEKFAAKTKTSVDDMLVDHTKRPVFYLILAYGLKISLGHLGLGGVVTNIIESAMALVFLLIILRLLDIVIEIWATTFAKKTKTMFDDVLLPLIHKATKVVFVVIGILWVLGIWHINITPYLAGVGISGLVLGLALQDSLKNVFGGVSLITDKNFHIGDAVKLESGELGVIKDVGLRSTKMLTYDHEVIFIPNGQLANMKIHNFMRPSTRIRKIVDFSVGYGTDPEKVKKVVLTTMQKVDKIFDEPYMDVIMVEMADFGLKFKARFWVDWPDAYSKYVEVTQAIYVALGRENIVIPYPTQTIHLVSKEK